MRTSNVKKAKVVKYLLKDDGCFPNNDKLPVLIYRDALDLPAWAFHASVVIKNIFAENGWTNAWRDGIYDFNHYHSVTHEVLGVYKGEAEIQLGGPDGIITQLRKGDVILIPAGVAHKCLKQKNFKCLGAYPGGAEYDMNYGKKSERHRTLRAIKQVPLPDKDPAYGNKGVMKEYWMPHITRLLTRRLTKKKMADRKSSDTDLKE
jgi:uncharacterized protein YjlB